MVRFILVACFVSVAVGVLGQAECGTEPTFRDIETLKRMEVRPLQEMMSSGQPVRVAVTAHIVRKSNGGGGLTLSQFNAALAKSNAVFEPYGLSFFRLGEINYIDNDNFYNFDHDDEDDLVIAHFVPNTINLYFFNSAKIGDTPICGYTYFPSEKKDYIMMVNECTVNGSTLSHELGHFFSLYHTHGKTNGGTTDELVDGSNCSVAGDNICDTPADPNLIDVVDDLCNYRGNFRDVNGDLYVPDARNLMSYSRKECRNHFSGDQGARILSAYHQFKKHLITNPYVADFKAAITTVCEEGQVVFSNHSIGAVSYLWSFPGGNPSMSTAKNPVVTYDSEGLHDVSLEITGSKGLKATKTRKNYVRVRRDVETEEVSARGSFEESTTREIILNQDNNITFKRTGVSSTEGGRSMMMNFYNYNSRPEEDYLIFSTLNTQKKKAFILTFDYAYAYYKDRSSSAFDRLSVEYREPCGEERSWKKIWNKGGADLATVDDGMSLTFVPKSREEWKRETVIFVVEPGVEKVEFAFKTVNGHGNNLYLDNYSIRPIVSSIDVVNATCSSTDDGSVTVNVVEDVGGLNYRLNEGSGSTSRKFEGLSTGTYTLTIKGRNNLEFSEKFTIEEALNKPTIGRYGPELKTEKGSFSIQWRRDGIPLLEAKTHSYIPNKHGTYTVAVTQKNCTKVSEEYVVAAPKIASVQVTKATCFDSNNGSIKVDVTGGAGIINYRIDNNAFDETDLFTDLKAGTYTIEVKDVTGATDTRSVVVGLGENVEKPIIRKDKNVLSIAFSDGLSIQWYLNDAPINEANGQFYLAQVGGSYSVKVSSKNCSVVSEPVEVKIVLSAEEIREKLKLYPIPVSDWLNLELPADLQRKITSIFIQDLTGKIVLSGDYSNRINLEKIKSGVYLLELKGEGFVSTKTFVKE